MRPQRLCARLAACLGTILIIGASVDADTIVLKNGRKIFALSVTESGDKIQYETASGTLTLPRSIVDHVERDRALAEDAVRDNELKLKPPDAAAAEPLLSSSYGEIQLRVIRNGEVDRGYIAELETQARSGAVPANQNAAL